MTKNRTENLLLFALSGIALWFYGNLYEGIVIAPNLLNDPIQKVQLWQNFFVTTNPVMYYIPVSPLAIVIIVILYFKTSRDQIILKKHLQRASIFGLLALGLGIYIITQINFKLFFGDIQKNSKDLYKLSVLWNVLNLIRTALLIPSMLYTFKACIWTKQNGLNKLNNKDWH